ncbi:MAG TPA: AI-2E family transporter, partial [Candidatus Methanoperedens sp.]
MDGFSVLIKSKWKIILGVIILLIVAGFMVILLPLVDGVIMGIVLAYVARPMKNFIDRYHSKLSPFLATCAIVVPIFLIIGLGVIEICNYILWIFKNQGYVEGSLLALLEGLNLPDFVRERTVDIISNFSSYLLPFMRQLPLIEIGRTFFSGFIMFIINILLAVILCFYLLADGGRLVDRAMDIIPADVEEFSRKFIKHFDVILSALFIGNTYSAI